MSELTTFILTNQTKVWNAIQSDPQWSFLKATCSGVLEVVEVCDRMGWATTAQAYTGIQGLNALASFLAPAPASSELSFDRADLKSVSYSDLLSSLNLDANSARSGTLVHADNGITHTNFTDVNYGVLSFAQIKEIADKATSAGLTYAPETMDCDDFSFVMKGWLAEQGLGNTSIGVAMLEIFDDRVLVEKHVALVAIDNTGNAWWVEPQNGEVYDIQNPYIWPTADRIVITDWIV